METSIYTGIGEEFECNTEYIYVDFIFTTQVHVFYFRLCSFWKQEGGIEMNDSS